MNGPKNKVFGRRQRPHVHALRHRLQVRTHLLSPRLTPMAGDDHTRIMRGKSFFVVEHNCRYRGDQKRRRQ